jgi:valyl-tRNA synthetase
MRARYENWIEGLNWDWNISRQRYYGVPFPVWYCRACERPIPASAEQLPVDPQETAPPVSACPGCGGTDFDPDPDVMDTWATSSVTPQICGTLLEPYGISPADFDARFRPMGLRPNAHDIIRTWDFYTVVRSLYHTADIPWSDVLISGHALDPSGKKISKSRLRTAEDPMPMLEQFSADAVRYWASSVRTGGDTNLSEEVFRNGSKLVTKLWNASKFALAHIEADPLPDGAAPALNASDRWLLARLHEVIRRATAAMEAYEFAVAKGETERFFWTDLCDNYLELIKLRLYGGASGRNGQTSVPGDGAAGHAGGGGADGAAPDSSGARYVLAQAIPAVIKLLAPFMPHITDAIYAGGLSRDGAASVHVSPWPVAPDDWNDAASRAGGEAMIQVVDAVRRWKAERKLSVGAPVGLLRITCPPDRRAALESARLDLLGVTRAQEVLLEDAPAGGAIAVAVAPAAGDALASPSR